MTEPPRWSDEQLQTDLAQAIASFRRERLEEPLEEYLEAFDTFLGHVEDLFETTVDLTELADRALSVLTDPALLRAFRYLAGPFISEDDLKTVAEAASLSPVRLQQDPEMVRRIIDVVLQAVDRRRFPWVRENREPSEVERNAAVLASAALMATTQVGTSRRSASKRVQEGKVEGALTGAGFTKVPTRIIPTAAQAPDAGEFCGESLLGQRKADFILRLWDHRVMPIECKVSNSATNSVKRLNNDAAAKATSWLHDFGATQVVPVAVLSGVYKLHNLIDAQARGLTLFWAHNLGAMIDWIETTRSS